MGKVVDWTGPSFRWLFPRSVRRLAWSRGSLRRALQHKVGSAAYGFGPERAINAKLLRFLLFFLLPFSFHYSAFSFSLSHGTIVDGSHQSNPVPFNDTVRFSALACVCVCVLTGQSFIVPWIPDPLFRPSTQSTYVAFSDLFFFSPMGRRKKRKSKLSGHGYRSSPPSRRFFEKKKIALVSARWILTFHLGTVRLARSQQRSRHMCATGVCTREWYQVPKLEADVLLSPDGNNLREKPKT